MYPWLVRNQQVHEEKKETWQGQGMQPISVPIPVHPWKFRIQAVPFQADASIQTWDATFFFSLQKYLQRSNNTTPTTFLPPTPQCTVLVGPILDSGAHLYYDWAHGPTKPPPLLRYWFAAAFCIATRAHPPARRTTDSAAATHSRPLDRDRTAARALTWSPRISRHYAPLAFNCKSPTALVSGGTHLAALFTAATVQRTKSHNTTQ